MIPKIVHFVFGLKEQKEEFHFIYAMAIVSAKIVLKPEKIYMWYHYEPHGKYWDKVKRLLTLEKVDIPTHIGDKVIEMYQHKADVVRLQKLREYGGIYLDIDTICVRPVEDLLAYDMVIGQEGGHGLCNAVMMAHKDAIFLRDWNYAYYAHFRTENWGECGVWLPKRMQRSKNYTNSFFTPECFFLKPSFNEVHLIFATPGYEIPQELRILHLWGSVMVWNNLPYMSYFSNLEQTLASDTLYGKIVRSLGENSIREILET